MQLDFTEEQEINQLPTWGAIQFDMLCFLPSALLHNCNAYSIFRIFKDNGLCPDNQVSKSLNYWCVCTFTPVPKCVCACALDGWWSTLLDHTALDTTSLHVTAPARAPSGDVAPASDLPSRENWISLSPQGWRPMVACLRHLLHWLSTPPRSQWLTEAHSWVTPIGGTQTRHRHKHTSKLHYICVF